MCALALPFVWSIVACKGSKSGQKSTAEVPYILPPEQEPVPIPESNAQPMIPPAPEEPVVQPVPVPVLPAPIPEPPPTNEPAVVESKPEIVIAGYPKSRIRFRVQIGAFAEPLAENDPFFGPVVGQEVRVDRSKSGWYRYSVGWFDNFPQAEAYKMELQAKGFKGVFLAPYGDDDKRIDMDTKKLLELYNQ